MQTAYRPPKLIALLTGLLLGLALQTTGCISAPPPKPNLIEQARKQNALGSDMARQFEAKLHYRADPVVNRYLDGIASMLAAGTGDPRVTDARVVVIADAGRQWRSFSLPGRKVYFPIGLLQQLRFDNEVAAVIALEDGNILAKHAIKRLNNQLAALTPKAKTAAPADGDPDGDEPASITVPVDFLGPNGIFSFSVDDMKESVQVAVKLMYGAGFDVRGLLEIWEKFQETPARSPYPPKELEELVEFTRSTISLYAPLRNPIVGTSGFQAIRKRIEEL